MSVSSRAPSGTIADAGAVFADERSRLVGLAYRMLGSRHDAEDAVQEAWLRWERADRSAIDRPGAWLTTTVSRLALDALRARQRERAEYVGPWLPEPVVLADDPSLTVERRDTLRLGFLHLLERLNPRERVAYVLAEVFGEPHAVVGAVLGASVVNSRQLVSRARRKLADGGGPWRRAAPHSADDDAAEPAADVVLRFLTALSVGDVGEALAAVAPGVVLVSDGGRDHHAARRPVLGPDRVVRLAANIAGRLPPDAGVAAAAVNGDPGVIVRWADGRPRLVMVFAVVDGAIEQISAIVNPDKLGAIDRPFVVA